MTVLIEESGVQQSGVCTNWVSYFINGKPLDFTDVAELLRNPDQRGSLFKFGDDVYDTKSYVVCW